MAFLDRITMNSATCFGFIPLRAGTLILLWLNLVVAVLMSTQSTKLMIMLMSDLPLYNKTLNFICSVIVLMLALLSIICTLLGFYGIRFKKSPSFLKPFIYLSVVESGFYALSIVAGDIATLFFVEHLQPYSIPDFVFWMFIQLCFLALKWHFVSVTYRYYEQWKAEVKPNHQYGNADVAYCPNTIP